MKCRNGKITSIQKEKWKWFMKSVFSLMQQTRRYDWLTTSKQIGNWSNHSKISIFWEVFMIYISIWIWILIYIET
jgi:histone acetyltransferase (RNA polymerase elongator complex component)